MTLYFGYGSNLDARDWNAFCGRWGFVGAELVPVSTAMILDYELAFDRYAASRRGGVLNLRARAGQAVEGVVFRANQAALYALDRKEGAPSHYRRLDRHAVMPDGQVLQVMTYAGPSQGFHPPHDDYLGVVLRGLSAHGIPHDMVAAAACDVTTPLTIGSLFVYGTLMRGEANAHHLDGIRRLRGSVVGRIHDCGAYPALALTEGEVSGEVIDLPLDRLASMDALEEAAPFGAPGGLYRRTVVRVTTDAGAVRAYAYVMDDASRFPVIAAGDWRSVEGRHAAWAAHLERCGGG
jgi:gamma-glutamylcyclotransferase (GGCT)/AIG2-like uncharacterized protein YtfP